MNKPFETICVMGLGYVGLPTAATIANRGIKVIGVDVNKAAVDLINQGDVHIVEPDLDIMVRAAVATGYLKATTEPEPADAFIIAVPTPFTGDKKPDLTFVKAAAEMLAPVLTKGNMVVIESTSPVGTTESLSEWLADARPDLSFPHLAREDADIQVAHSPERVLPGKVLLEMVANDRVVGGITPNCSRKAVALYKLFVEGDCLETTARTAELVKLTENAFRDVNIAFANELSLVCDKLGVDVWDVIDMSNRHPRVNVLKPGPGVGGHCIAVDPWFIVDSAPDETPLIQAARNVNDFKPHHIVNMVKEAAKSQPDEVIAFLGLSYKADIDDLRESPAVEIVEEFGRAAKQPVLVVEPNTQALPQGLQDIPGLKLTGLQDALERAGIIVLLVDHKPFRDVSPASLKGKTIFDTRGMWREK